MKLIRDPEPGHPIRASHIKDIVDAIRELQNIRVGPGLVMHQTGGVTIGLRFPRGGRGGGKAETCSRTEPTDLAHVQGTQDTDDWAKDDDACAVEVTVITDVQYDPDPTSHKLQFRTRTLKFDSCGKLYEVTAEGDLVDITTAEECP
jgi:hypothetical protein